MKPTLCSRCHQRPAVVFITRVDGDKSTPEGLCIKCAKELNIGPINDIMKRMNTSDEDIDAMNEEFVNMMESFGDGDGMFDFGGSATLPFMQSEAPDDAEKIQKSDAPAKEKSEKTKKEKHASKRKFLNNFCKNLTAEAKAGKIDKIIGRDRELNRVIQILSRRQKNNPCLIGEPGVGKTAIAEGLALKIASGDVPSKLIKKEVFLLDLTALVAGTQFRGQFESRIKGLIDEVKAEGNIILFIDEVHNLVGVGDAEGSMNAANILKPALSRGEIQVVGATTFNEYRKYIEKDAALERRFQSVKVEEPSITEAIAIIEGIKEYYENFHSVTLSPDIVRKTVTLSERYINDRFLPDKAIDLLDEACACAALRNKTADRLLILTSSIAELQEQAEELDADVENPDFEKSANIKSELAKLRNEQQELLKLNIDNSVTDDDLARVIELWTGIPASKVKQSDLKRLAFLEDNIKKRIIGQDEAVHEISNAVRRSRVRVSAGRRPASFIFVGPTGVGKTELVKVLANELFNTPETLIRLDMSEYMEKHSVSKIIGSPPGYVGYDEAGQLTEKVRRKPYSVLLFDEIEKAHPDVLNILLQILDEGRITDAQGRTVAFDNTVIVMTSNAGSDKKDSAIGFAKTQKEISKEKAEKALREFLRPEFISRVDEIICFSPLSDADIDKIAVLMLDELKDSLKESGIELTYDEDTVTFVASKNYSSPLGARGIRGTIRKEIEDKIAKAMVEHCDEVLSKISIICDNEKILVSIS